MNRLVLLAVVAGLGGCPTPQTGTINLGLATAPGSTLLDSVTELHVSLTHPRQTVIAARGPNGFKLSLDVEATGESGAIVVEGFDANGLLVAVGQSPEFGVAAVNARIVVYMASPMSIDRAPIMLTPDRKNISVTPLTYGVMFAGGRNTADNAPSDAVAIYNTYDHSLAGGLPLLAPRDGIILATANNGLVYLFGGLDGNDNPTGTLWFFDTNFNPSGAYLDLGDFPAYARSGGTSVLVGLDKFVLTGMPPLDLAGRAVTANTGAAQVLAGDSVPNTDGSRTALLVGMNGNLLLLRAAGVEPLATSRPGAAVGVLPDGRFIVVGGGTVDEANDLLVIDGKTGAVTVAPDVLSTTGAIQGVAVTKRHIVVTGQTATADILDAGTLAPLAVRDTLVGEFSTPKALPNGQVLLVGFEGKLSLFTPPPPALD